MTHDFNIKQGDTRPSIEVQLLDENREPQDLQTAEGVDFHMKSVDTQEVVVDGSAVILNVDEAKVAYEWSSGDTDIPGRHEAEFEVLFPQQDNETFPNDGDIEVYITEEIA